MSEELSTDKSARDSAEPEQLVLCRPHKRYRKKSSMTIERDNPFVPGGAIDKETTEILRHSVITSGKIVIVDPRTSTSLSVHDHRSIEGSINPIAKADKTSTIIVGNGGVHAGMHGMTPSSSGSEGAATEESFEESLSKHLQGCSRKQCARPTAAGELKCAFREKTKRPTCRLI